LNGDTAHQINGEHIGYADEIVIKNVIKIYNYYENRESELILSLPRWGVEDETGQTTRSDTSDGDSSDPSE
jgi:hypothetical protein